MNHTGKCFKADCFECRMKIPMKQCPSTEVQFEEKRKEWYDWNGRKYTRQLFVLELQRKFIDCFVNTYNEIATASIGCNTNVVPAVDGGSIIYCTLYLSKNEQNEMENKFANTANLVLKKLIQLRDHDDRQKRQQQQLDNEQCGYIQSNYNRVQNMGVDDITNNMNTDSNNFNNNNNNGNENEASINNEQNESNSFDDGKRKGMRAMISSVLQLTNCLKTSSPMAAAYIP